MNEKDELFDALKEAIMGNTDTVTGRKVVEKLLAAHPDQTFFRMSQLWEVESDPKNIVAAIVAIQDMEDEGIVKHHYALTDKEGNFIPGIYDEVEDIPDSLGACDLVSLFSRKG
jgi:hypothetical protein